MDLGTALSAVQTLFSTLQCSELKDLCSILGYKSELDNLKCVVDSVKAVLDDADSVQDQVGVLSHARLYIDQLKDVVYDADDLLDEFLTLAEQKKLINNDGSVTRKVCRLFSRFDSLAVAYRMSRGVVQIRKRLDVIASNYKKFAFKLDHRPTLRRRDSCSYVYAQDVIGRKNDVEEIVTRLLDPNVARNVSCLTIVGIGGLGKTTLAQLVYNDPRIVNEFSLRLWTCVSDQDHTSWDVRAILCKILHLITHGDHEDLDLEPLQKQLQEQLVQKKFLLVLDDVWSEDRLQWLDLERFLMSGLKGSWIIVTTRSEKTATITGDTHMYKLKGLSDRDSWSLFEITAFGGMYEQTFSSELVEIGQRIVKRCANVPLAIKVVGSLLYGQGKDKWESFQKIGLGRLKSGKNGGIEPILKLSYHHLDSPLKTCFCYCAIFPKDHVIEKEMLINLWMAQDYIAPLQEGQSIEDAADEYFSILVKRCFFQDLGKDEYDNIVSCKIHDLMHDIAQEVVAKEICAINSITTSLDNKVRHLSYVFTDEGTKMSFAKTKIRTYLHFGHWQQGISVDTLLRNWTCLRTLDLSKSSIKSLPSALGKLLHLRYLDLSGNHDLERLPKAITKLINLQTLNLRQCQRLKELPEDLSDLVKLRVLDIDYSCSKLTCMPRGMGKLKCLRKLPMFVLGDGNANLKKQSAFGQMEDLKALTNLKGCLLIHILSNFKYARGNGGCIRNKKDLYRVNIQFPGEDKLEFSNEELLLEDLQPHRNLKDLTLSYYVGINMPSWTKEDYLAIHLPNLVKIKLYHCTRLHHLPSLGKLRHLKSLTLFLMDGLEYIETTSKHVTTDVSGSSGSELFFPSLDELNLSNLPKLKGWWRGNEMMDCTEDGKELHVLPSFPCLSKLTIWNCPELAYLPSCPTVKELDLWGKLNKKLRIMDAIEPETSKLRKLRSRDPRYLKWVLPMEAFDCLQEMEIGWVEEEMESLTEVENVFRSCSSSLQNLLIYGCDKLKSLCGGLEHLAALEVLQLRFLPNLNLSNNGRDGVEENGDEMPWCHLHHCLRSLELNDIPKMVSLPKGICHLTALRSLLILNCKGLESLPESIRKLTSLEALDIRGCSLGLLKRCQDNTGEDWPNIQHIPNRHIAC